MASTYASLKSPTKKPFLRKGSKMSSKMSSKIPEIGNGTRRSSRKGSQQGSLAESRRMSKDPMSIGYVPPPKGERADLSADSWASPFAAHIAAVKSAIDAGSAPTQMDRTGGLAAERPSVSGSQIASRPTTSPIKSQLVAGQRVRVKGLSAREKGKIRPAPPLTARPKRAQFKSRGAAMTSLRMQGWALPLP
jgi:hypothetical protein